MWHACTCASECYHNIYSSICCLLNGQITLHLFATGVRILILVVSGLNPTSSGILNLQSIHESKEGSAAWDTSVSQGACKTHDKHIPKFKNVQDTPILRLLADTATRNITSKRIIDNRTT